MKLSLLFTAVTLLTSSIGVAETHRVRFAKLDGDTPESFRFTIFDFDTTKNRTQVIKLGDTFAGLKVTAFRKITSYVAPGPLVDALPVNESEIILTDTETRKTTAIPYNRETRIEFPNQTVEPTR